MSKEIQELEAQKAGLIQLVELRDTILKLSGNFEFRKVFHEEFFVKDAARNARIAGDPNLDDRQRNDAMQMAIAAGHVQRFLSANVLMGNRAEEDIRQIDEMIEQHRMEG